jgi:hypothetical protein
MGLKIPVFEMRGGRSPVGVIGGGPVGVTGPKKPVPGVIGGGGPVRVTGPKKPVPGVIEGGGPVGVTGPKKPVPGVIGGGGPIGPKKPISGKKVSSKKNKHMEIKNSLPFSSERSSLSSPATGRGMGDVRSSGWEVPGVGEPPKIIVTPEHPWMERLGGKVQTDP